MDIYLIVLLIGFLLGFLVFWRPKKKHKPKHFRFRVGRPERKELPMLELNCTNEEKILVKVNTVTTTGKPAILDGVVTVEVQAGDGTVAMEADGLSFYVISGDNPGDTTYLVSADADMGEGVETISDIVTLHVAGAKAASLGLVAEAPIPK